MNNPDDFRRYDLTDTTYDYIDCYVIKEQQNFCGINFHGNLKDPTCEYKHFDMRFGRITTAVPIDSINKYQQGVLRSITVDGTEKDSFSVSMEIENCKERIALNFQCKSCNIHFKRYRGIDYTNVFGNDRYNADIEKVMYLEDEKYLESESETEIGDGFSLLKKNYSHKYNAMSRYFLKKDGEPIYSYISVDRHHIPHKKLIYHSNGHRYYPHHIDLYGISYVDVDTLEVFNYIPKGYDTDYDVLCGESFIVTAVYYDANTNLVAYEGCYWADTSDVMVGDLSEPLNFNPRLVSIHDMIDPDYDYYDDVDFFQWNENTLSVKLDSNEIREIPLEKLTENFKQ